MAIVGDGSEYERTIAHATHAVDTVTAIYWPKRTDPFTPDMLDAEYVNSPLTDKAVAAAGRSCYLLLAVHLDALRTGHRRSLAGVSQIKAWRFLKEIERTDATMLNEFRDRLSGR